MVVLQSRGQDLILVEILWSQALRVKLIQSCFRSGSGVLKGCYSVQVVLQRCYKGDTNPSQQYWFHWDWTTVCCFGMIHRYYSGVTCSFFLAGMLLGSYRRLAGVIWGVTRGYRGATYGIKGLLQGCYRGVTGLTNVWPQQTGRSWSLSMNFNGIRESTTPKQLNSQLPKIHLYLKKNPSNNWDQDATFSNRP